MNPFFLTAFLPTTSNSTEAEIRVDKPEAKPKVNHETLNLNGNKSVESHNHEELPDSPTFNKYEYMSKNLTQRLNQMSSNPIIGEDTLVRHDLYEIDRKRKLVTEELEALQRRRHEEFEAMKLLQQRKNDLLNELNELQKCIEKEKGFMRQLEKEILAKSRFANVPVPEFMRARLEQEQEWEHNKPQQNHEQPLQRQQQQLDREVQHLKSTHGHDQQHQPKSQDVLQHLTPPEQIRQLQQQKELQQLQHQKDIHQLREQQRQKELLQQRQQQEKIKQQQIHHQRQQQLQQQQQKMQRIAPKSMDPLQQQQQQQGYGYPGYNQLPPPPPLGHMGRGPYRHGAVARPPPPPQSYLPHHFQGHPRHQALMEGNNGASAQPPPQLHQARQHQQQIHHKQVLSQINF